MGWRQVSKEVAVEALSFIYDMDESEAEAAYDSFVNMYGRQPTIIEVKMKLGWW